MALTVLCVQNMALTVLCVPRLLDVGTLPLAARVLLRLPGHRRPETRRAEAPPGHLNMALTV